MSEEGISDEIRQFIFGHIDSVEQIEVILCMRNHPDRWWSIQAMTDELRSSYKSIANRISILRRMQLLEQSQETPVTYRYQPRSPKLASLVDELAETYRVRRHKVMELVYSPIKKVRPFADAFAVTRPPKKNGDEDG